MAAPIVGHIAHRPIEPELVNEGMAERAIETIARQHAEALPKVPGQLWERVADGHTA